MSEDMSEDIKICQKECQKICQKECQKICQTECQKMCVTVHKASACGSCSTAANTRGSTFRAQASEVGLAAMSELVVERPATIFIGTSSRFAKGVVYVWRYVLTTVGPERIYVRMEPPSTTHAGDCMFIVPEARGCGWNFVVCGVGREGCSK